MSLMVEVYWNYRGQRIDSAYMDEKYLKELQERCEKKRFSTKEEAQERLNEIRAIDDGKRKPIRIYGCRVCNGFHLTSFDRSLQRTVEHRKAINISKRIYRTALYWIRKKGWTDQI